MEDQLQKTAVEWYADQLFEVFSLVLSGKIQEFDQFNVKCHNLIERAKMMERHQLMEAFNQGINQDSEPNLEVMFDRYFNKTYK